MVTVAFGTPALEFFSSCTVPRIAPLILDCARIGDVVAEANRKNRRVVKAKNSKSKQTVLGQMRKPRRDEEDEEKNRLNHFLSSSPSFLRGLYHSFLIRFSFLRIRYLQLISDWGQGRTG